MRLKRTSGVKLICPKHGAAALVLRDRGSTAEHHYEVTCKGKSPRGRRVCQHHEYASRKQIENIFRAYPDCDLEEYQPSAWDMMFESEK